MPTARIQRHQLLSCLHSGAFHTADSGKTQEENHFISYTQIRERVSNFTKKYVGDEESALILLVDKLYQIYAYLRKKSL